MPPRPVADPETCPVRAELLARQIESQIASRFRVGRRLRILDTGLRGGAQALRLARAGHELTGLEPDPTTLAATRETLAAEPAGIRERVRLLAADGRDTGAHFLPGTFDVVLCHDLPADPSETEPTLAGVARVLAPGGLLSLVVGNADALAMRPGLAGDWETAGRALDPSAAAQRASRASRLEHLTGTLSGIGTPLHHWYGLSVFTGWRAADAVVPATGASARAARDDVHDPAERERLLAVEERAGRTDPYRAVARWLHLCGVRG